MELVTLILASFLAYSYGKATPAVEENLAENGDDLMPLDIDFMAYRLEPIDDSIGSHKPLKLEGVKGNVGGNFDLDTGYFTAPSKGLYVFNVTTYATMKRRIRLMKDNYEIKMVSNDGRGRAKQSKLDNVLLQLVGGDRIWLRLAHRKRETDEKRTGSSLTTFSGRLLTTDVHINMPPSSSHHHSKRHKRSSGQRSESLRRQIRQANYLPVSLVDKNPPTAVNHDGSGYDVTGGSEKRKIAFSVTCTKSMIGGHMADTTESLNGDMSPEAAPNGRIGFDKTLVNIGGGFDAAAGEFVAPSDGVYFFSYNVGKFPRKKLSVMLMKNFNEIQSIIYNDSKTRAREIQGQSLMLQLQEGDTMWLRSYNEKDYAVYSNLGNYITFSGYLVY